MRASKIVIAATALVLLLASGAARVAHAAAHRRHGRRQPPVGARLHRRLACRTARRRTSTYDADDDVWQGTFTVPAGELGVQGAAQRRLGRELRR